MAGNKKEPKVTTYLLQHPDIKQLNLMFYQSYDEKFLYSKALALHYMAYGVKDQQPFKDHLASIGLSQNDVNNKFFEAIRAEIYFTAMHQFECLFALFLALFQPNLPHWFYLSEYQPGDVRKAAMLFLDENIKDLTGYDMDRRTFLHQEIYSGFVLQDYPEDQWQKNLDNIAWLLDRIAEQYIAASAYGGGEYNAYKHGLRVTTGPSVISIGLQKETGIPASNPMVVGASNDAIRFLQMEKDKAQDGKLVYHVTKHFNPEESLFFLCKMQQMVEMIKVTRLAQMNGEILHELNLFLDLDKAYVLSLKGDGTVIRFTL